ncbi:zinc finger BED domain-containing protein 5-like [Octopus sinensis]|uniref:Zinc finger BED domain-containing protein 5-like n=1 Tax=Octopus sinensis TaxID=2607531 RepID=A0A6P7U017_9MOLL|nr:zinc finger BED domain-containing protein 5-like [Octopus sinensis]
MHFSLRDKKSSYFKNMLKSQKTQSATFVKTLHVSQKALEASYLVAELIFKNRKNHTIGEKLILPACKIIVSKILGKEATKKIDNIPLSNNTISRRLQDISENIEEFVNGKLIHSNFSIQVDESTDFSSESHVIVFVRFVGDMNHHIFASSPNERFQLDLVDLKKFSVLQLLKEKVRARLNIESDIKICVLSSENYKKDSLFMIPVEGLKIIEEELDTIKPHITNSDHSLELF